MSEGGIMRVGIVASEVAPFSKTGGLADVTGSLPRALARLGVEVALFSPLYRAVMETGRQIALTDIEIPVKVGERIVNARLGRKKLGGVQFYFIDNREFFDRDQLYGTMEGDYPDNCERFVFFNQAVLEAMVRLDFRPDIIHCHDWQAALMPLYLKEYYPRSPVLGQARTVFTIHNLGYQGRFPGALYPLLGLPWEYFTPSGLEFYGQINFLKAGLSFGRVLTTVSPTYAREIQTSDLGFGLDGVLKTRSRDLYGVLNGIDESVWNPASDKQLSLKYSAANARGRKTEIKRALLTDLGLSGDERPLLALIARLSEQKGLELLVSSAAEIVKLGANLVVLGTGEEHYHELLTRLKQELAGNFALRLKFDEALAHRIYAGADVMLIPSRYEPCGLSQMIAMRYGTVPLAYCTGGLADTILDIDDNPESGNGFLFTEYTPAAFLAKVRRALAACDDARLWDDLIQRGMKTDHSWGASAARYVELYESAVGKTNPQITQIESSRSRNVPGGEIESATSALSADGSKT
jgi:starch synthase